MGYLWGKVKRTRGQVKADAGTRREKQTWRQGDRIKRTRRHGDAESKGGHGDFIIADFGLQIADLKSIFFQTPLHPASSDRQCRKEKARDFPEPW
jgi:hypothetical protein